VEIYKLENNLSNKESELLLTFLKDCLDRKKLQRVKDVVYDKENGIVKDIPALCYLKTTKHL
jgi:transposase-like protein